jgi:hypothetical protein
MKIKIIYKILFSNDIKDKIIIFVFCLVMVNKTKYNMKKYILLLICIIIKFKYFKK